MVRIPPSHPDYPVIELALRDLAMAINPWCWFGVDSGPELERGLFITESKLRLYDLLVDVTFKELTDGMA